MDQSLAKPSSVLFVLFVPSRIVATPSSLLLLLLIALNEYVEMYRVIFLTGPPLNLLSVGQ